MSLSTMGRWGVGCLHALLLGLPRASGWLPCDTEQAFLCLIQQVLTHSLPFPPMIKPLTVKLVSTRIDFCSQHWTNNLPELLLNCPLNSYVELLLTG